MTTQVDQMTFLQRARAAWQLLTGKAISHHPELEGRQHVYSSSADQGFQQQISEYVGWATVYQSYVWVAKAVTIYANSVAALPVRVVNSDGEPQDSHPLTQLLGHVNESEKPADLWQSYCLHKLLGGESFIRVIDDRAGQPAELWARRPDQMLVIPDETQARLGFPIVAGYTDQTADDVNLGRDQVIHDKYVNPLSAWRGLSPISAAREDVTIDIYAQQWSQRFLKNGARPDYALIAPEGLGPTERDEYLAILTEKHQGPDNWHKPIVLEHGVTDIKSFSFPPVDVQWLEQRGNSRQAVGSILGIPDEVMGWGKDTYENMDQAHQWLWLLTLLPFIRARDLTLSSFFTRTRPMLTAGERVATDLSTVKAVQEDITVKADAAQKYWSMGIPWNMINDRLGLDLGPVPGGDVGFVPIGVMPILAAAERTAPTGMEPAQVQGMIDQSVTQALDGLADKLADRMSGLWVPGQVLTADGPGPAIQITADASDAIEQLAQVRAAVSQIKVQPQGPEYGGQVHKALWKSIQGVSMPFENRMADQLERDLERQAKAVARAVAALAEDVPEGREPHIPSTAKDLFDLDEWVLFFALAYEPLYTDMTRAAGADVLAKLAIDVPFDMSVPYIQQAIKDMRFKFADDINGATLEQLEKALRQLLTDAADNGWTAWQTQKELGIRTDNVFGLRTEDWQRQRIARTEMGKARSIGRQESARQSGVIEQKTWLAAMDERTRDTHFDAHLTYSKAPIGLDDQFQIGADRMLAPRMGTVPAENIQCRCDAVYLVAGASPDQMWSYV